MRPAGDVLVGREGLAVTLLFTVAPDLLPSRRYPTIVAISVLVPTLAYLIGGLGFGTYTGSVGTILAFIGVGRSTPS